MSVQGRERLQEDPEVVRLSGELDAGDAGFADELMQLSGGSDYVIVDMLNVSFIDSSVIRALVLVHRRVTDAGGWLRLVYTHHMVRRVIEMCGLAAVFPQYPTIDAARRGAPSHPPQSEFTGPRGRVP